MTNTYGFDPVAWSIDGGRHPADLLRLVSYADSGGAEGIVSSTDCKVHQLTTPGSQVVIDAGALLIRNRSANVTNQTYVANGRLPSTLDVTPTGAGAGRSDLVVVRVEDPQYAPWAKPAAADAPTYQYVKPFIIQNVPASTTSAVQLNLGYSAVALARLDIPASTSVITNAMVKELRKVARPRRQREVRIWSPTATEELREAGGRTLFPSMRQLVGCPEWATELKAVVHVGGLKLVGDSTGVMRVEYGWNGVDPYLYTQDTGIDHRDSSAGQVDRMSIPIGSEMKIPATFRGKDHYVRIGSDVNAGATGYWVADVWTTVVVDLEFVEVAD